MVTSFEVGVPIPRRSANQKYPFDELPVNGSFFVPADEGSVRRVQSCLSNCARSYGRKHGLKFTTRVQHEPTGVRVWRTA